jgi:hypothetical protein
MKMQQCKSRQLNLSPGNRIEEYLQFKKDPTPEFIKGLIYEIIGAYIMTEQPFIFPVSFAQERLWYLDQLEPGTAAYNIPIPFRLKGKLNKDALKRSINEIVRRHEALRTTIDVDGDLPIQVIAPSLELKIPLVDFSDKAASERQVVTGRSGKAL